MTNAPSSSLGLKKVSSGGGVAGPDTIARAAAAKAQTNVNAITAQAGETIPVNGVVVTPTGLFENKTGAPVPLTADDPQTAATVAFAGLTPFTSGSTDTGTNFVIPATAFADGENPLQAEAKAWYEAITATDRTTGDTATYTSLGGIQAWYVVGDGDNGTESFTQAALIKPTEGMAIAHISAVQPLTTGTKWFVDASALTATGQSLSQSSVAQDYVDFPITDGVNVDDELQIVGRGNPYKGIHMVGSFQGGDTFVINEPNEQFTLTWTTSGYVVVKG